MIAPKGKVGGVGKILTKAEKDAAKAAKQDITKRTS